MRISGHQIENVLKVYSEQLCRKENLNRQKAENKKPPADHISAEAKRISIIEKIASNIVERITTSGPKDDVEHEIADLLENRAGHNVSFNAHTDDKFVFNVIDENNEKTTQTLIVENSNFLLKRLEQLAKETVDDKVVAYAARSSEGDNGRDE